MRVGTVLSYKLPTGDSHGVVSTLVDVSTVRVIDASGKKYVVTRGQGHKHEDQNGSFCTALRERFGIEIGPCQKSQFGADAVHKAEKLRKNSKPTSVGFPIPIAEPKQKPVVMAKQAKPATPTFLTNAKRRAIPKVFANLK